MSTTPTLGRLERVDLRSAWQSEAGGFTPWLAQEENIALLGETLDLELEVEAQEKNVGPFRADILCKDAATNAWVLIENQLERTDHSHLGQLLTYAAGLEAVTIIWIAQAFTEEHRATLDWLNQITDERFNFFGLEVELWRIGTSPPAPKFNIVSKPNDWTKQVARGAQAIADELTPAKQLQLEYWTAFGEYMRQAGSFIKPTKPLLQHWMNIALGRAGFWLAAIASFYDSESRTFEGNELRTEMSIRVPNAKQVFVALEAQKTTIEQALGEPLAWHNPAASKSAKVYLRRSADLQNRSDWPSQHAWLREKLEKLHRVFNPLIRQLDLSTASAPGAEVSG
jgi:hypothetical protein